MIYNTMYIVYDIYTIYIWYIVYDIYCNSIYSKANTRAYS